ncbi:hypothetical protein NC653_038008 [Populus alba x Populus x berolinensis]|uniref:Uncharacterized protein n=1 Tax=Populus alba x Populus x berolinensis TaxID=444605 RepID=A0AAD6PUB0_9ROSI|nr:hypothetical protein NC653_038008 [Populus alba x Populus x berolinensis]
MVFATTMLLELALLDIFWQMLL